MFDAVLFLLLFWIYLSPNSGKWRLGLGFPTKHVLVLVVTLTWAAVDQIQLILHSKHHVQRVAKSRHLGCDWRPTTPLTKTTSKKKFTHATKDSVEMRVLKFIASFQQNMYPSPETNIYSTRKIIRWKTSFISWDGLPYMCCVSFKNASSSTSQCRDVLRTETQGPGFFKNRHFTSEKPKPGL